MGGHLSTERGADIDPGSACLHGRAEGIPEIASFVSALISSFGDRLKSVYFFGSRARGEGTPKSDYDLIVIVDRVDDEAIQIFRAALDELQLDREENNECPFQPFFWSMEQLSGIPPHYFYLGARLLYGEPLLTQPSPEELRLSFLEITRNLLNTVTHYLILPHNPRHVAERIYDKLKQLYFGHAALYCIDTGSFPSNRREVIQALERRGDLEGCELLTILDKWNECDYTATFAQNPNPMLYRILKYVETLLPVTARSGRDG